MYIGVEVSIVGGLSIKILTNMQGDNLSWVPIKISFLDQSYGITSSLKYLRFCGPKLC